MGKGVAVISSGVLSPSALYKVTISRDGTTGFLIVNETKYTGQAGGNWVNLDLAEQKSYLGMFGGSQAERLAA